jgi:hypothetical protein
MMRATIRLLTTIALIVIGGMAVAQGWGIVRFFLASTNIVSAEKRARTADAWRATSGIISTALNDELVDETSQSDIIAAYRQRELLSAILSIKPLSSGDWLALSKAELMTHQPMEEDVFGSLELSTLTGPNESYVMGQRAVFALSLWERLPADLKRHAAVDVAAMMLTRTPAEGEMLGKIGAVLATQPESVRNELREAVIATGVSPEEIKKGLGF